MGCATCYTQNAIDITNFNKLVVVATSSSSGSARSLHRYIELMNVKPDGINQYENVYKSFSIQSGTEFINIFDISTLEGSYWIMLLARSYSGDSQTNGWSSGSVSQTIYKVYLSK